MTESGTVSDKGPTPGDSPGWGESLSRELGDLARAAETLTVAWNQRFGTEAFQNPLFAKAFLGQVRGHSILGVFKTVYAQDHGSEKPSEGSFEERFERTASGVGEATPVLDPVPLSPLDYLSRLVALAQAQKKEGFLVDPQPLQRILTFVSQLKDLPAISRFRVDQLNQFPSRVVETPPLESFPTEAPAGVASPEEEPVLRELPEGYRIGKVQVVRRLGVGGFAQVYLVFHAGLREHWAAKLFTKRDLLGELPTLLKAFYAEAQLQVKLKSPHIVRVIDVEEHEGYLVLFMEYVDGRNLRSLIEERKKAKTHLMPLEILRISIEGAKALEHAHTLGIVHRDMKPENILIAQDGSVKITDFGLAKALDATGQRRTTQLGHLLGTPQYMAPEQILGGPYDHRVDLYSLGVVIYHMAWGQPPFIGGPWELLDMQKSKKPVPLTHRMKDFPAELNRIVMKLLEKKPENRYSSAAELIKDLESCQAALSLPGPRPAGRRPRLRPVLTGVALCLVAAVSAYFGLRGRTPASAAHRALAALDKPALQPTAGPETPPPGNAPPLPSKDAQRDPKEVSLHQPEAPPSGRPEAKPDPSAVSKPSPAREAPSLRKQLLSSPPTKEDALFIDRLLDLFSQHRSQLLLRSYEPLALDLEALEKSQLKKSDFMDYELSVAKDIVRMAEDVVQARFKDLARSKEELHLKLADGSIAQGVVDRVEAGAITLIDAGNGKTSVDLGQMAPEEFLSGKTAPLAELAYQTLSGDGVKAMTTGLALEKDQEKIILWYPLFARMGRHGIQERVKRAVLQAIEILAKGDRPDVARLPNYPQLLASLKTFLDVELSVTPFLGSLTREFDRARDEKTALDLILREQYSKILSGLRGTEAHPFAAKLLLAGFEGAFDAPSQKATPKKSDELIAGGGWFKYTWKLHPDEKTLAERQQFWQLDGEKDGSILRDPQGPRSLIMYEAHPRLPEGLILRADFEPLGDGGAESQWRLLVVGEDGHNNYLRFDPRSMTLDRTFKEGPGASEDPLASAPLPALASGQRTRSYVLIRGDEGFHIYVDDELVATVARKDCVIPAQLQIVVLKGKLSLKSILVKSVGK